jgi:hypothetical protein
MLERFIDAAATPGVAAFDLVALSRELSSARAPANVEVGPLYVRDAKDLYAIKRKTTEIAMCWHSRIIGLV